MPYRKIKEFTDEELLDTINKKRAKMLALQKEIGHIQTYLLLKRLVGGGKNDQQCKEKTIQTNESYTLRNILEQHGKRTENHQTDLGKQK